LGMISIEGMEHPDARETRIRDAHNLWLQITPFPAGAVSVPNRALAYYGLCRQVTRQSRRLMRDAPEAERLSYLAYFYCRQAEALYAGLPGDRRAKPGIKRAEARVLHARGSGLESIQRKTFEPEKFGRKPLDWDCRAGDLTQSPYAPASLRYYVRALTLSPDDRRIQCYAARTAYVLGDPKLMERLNMDPGAHVNRASRHRRWANVCSLIERSTEKIATYLREIQAYDRLVKRCQPTDVQGSVKNFRLALEEFNKAIVRDELNFEALTGYADTYWEWWVNWQSSMVHNETTAVAGTRAEVYARRAIALAGARPDPMAQPMAQFTLGKVLLTRGRPTGISSAIEQFEAAVGSVAHRPSFDDMRLSLLQVYRCASETYMRAGLQGSLQILNGKIIDLEWGIQRETQHDDQARAPHAFNGRSSPLDSIGKGPICSGESVMESSKSG
jgi:hypothetical protein